MLDCRLELQEIELQLCVSLLLGPKIEWDRRHLIHDRFGAAALRHVHGFYIAPATVASFHPDVLDFVGGVDGKLRVILLAATGTDDSAKLPFRQTK